LARLLALLHQCGTDDGPVAADPSRRNRERRILGEKRRSR
jgi:hypothetical protein